MMYPTVDPPKETVEQKIKDIVSIPRVASVATIVEGKPWVRYMVVFYSGKDLTLMTSSFLQSRKVQQIQDNPHVHITLGDASSSADFTGTYIQFAGTAEVKSDAETRHMYWNDMLKAHYSGPDDPNLSFVFFKPEVIELWGEKDNPMTPYVWKA